MIIANQRKFDNYIHMRTKLPYFTVLALVSALLYPIDALARVSRDTNVKSFTLRKFDDQGVRIWDLSGREALFLSDNLIRVIDMQLALSSTQDGASGQTILRSPNANIFVNDSFAEGEGFIFIQGSGYTVRGDEWNWNGRDQTIQIRRNTRVTFDEAIRQVLR